ncbi:MAG: hypothetical protein WC081_05890 [Candidatus Ratteibacteria bacterium]|jgi:hypothetical protein
MNKKPIVLAVLMLFSLGFLFFSLHLTGKKPNPVKNETEVIGEENFWKETADLLEKSKQAGMPIYYHTTQKDPMRPAFTSAGTGPFQLILKGELAPSSLTGILLGNGGKATAIINEKILRVGDIVNDKKIVAIEKNRVILKRGTDEEILRFGN